MEITYLDLKEKEVIDINSGKRLGCITDIIFDLKKFTLEGFVVCGDKKLFKKSDDIIIKTNQIHSIGGDVVIVSLTYEKEIRNGSCFDDKVAGEMIYKKGDNFVRFKKLNKCKYE